MNTLLNLTIKRCWFDMIASGEKREEYRSLDNKKVGDKFVYNGCPIGAQVMVLRNGYNMVSPALAVRVYGIILRNGDDSVHPEWGEPTDRTHFVIMLGDVLMRGTYAEVKEALKKGDGKSSNEKQETVADIVARMRDEGHTGDASCLEWVGAKILHYADRIEAAAERENARLRAALKPVLECKVLGAMTAEIRPGESDYCSNIIFKAQRIYNEGE